MHHQHLEKIKALSKKKKVGLFIGRDNTEPLPEELGWSWISLDAYEEEGTDRIHLKENFNHEKPFFLLRNLFDRVVVDQETWKFFEGNPLPRLTHLLKPIKASTLIFEAEPSLFLRPLAKKYFYDHVDIQVPMKFEEVKAYPAMILNAKKTARLHTRQYLKTLFRKVELILNEPFPYPTNYRTKADPHYIASDPKSFS